SYTVVRRYLRDGHLPPTSAVRVEEMVNYFSYGDAPPRRGDFALTAEGGPAIFAQTSRYRLLRFHLQARRLAPAERRPSVMMLVVDVSGSMQWENRLDTVRRSLAMLVDHLEPGDRIGLISFGATARLLVEPTADHDRLRSAIERLVTDGSTNAEAGLVMAYETLARYRQPGTTRRVILCSDGVANVGETDAERILERVHREAEGGIELTTVGFGMGNYNDALMEKLADQGDGRYAYVDDLREARRVFVEELTGTLETVASDARVQVEFDRQHVERYRLLGYENRDMKDELFRDDTADAGEIGSGHGVTALYEVKLERGVERLGAAHLATLRLRYRSTASGHFEEQEIPIDLEDLAPTWQDTSRALRLSTLVAEFAEILRGSYWAKGGDLHEVFRRAQQVSAEYPGDVRVAEFAALVGRAAELVDAGKKPGE
ncbi:MAG: von Willebrand factor type A domain-containing protein, partial [Acidobacteria bacterium]|nr:von Willebrand factor type A domain-containing protein [Acidobacteriota bacterium]